MAYSWDNRVKFVVRYMYDIDGNGTLDKSDFECLAVRNTVIEVSFFFLFKCDMLALALLRIKILLSFFFFSIETKLSQNLDKNINCFLISTY